MQNIILQESLPSLMMPAETVDSSQLQAARALMTLAENDCTQQPDDKVEEIPTEVELTKCFLDITVPTAPMSPYHLVYEALAQEPWKVLIGSLLMKRVNTVTGRCMVLDFFKKFPTLESIKTVHLVDFFMVGSIKIFCTWFSVWLKIFL